MKMNESMENYLETILILSKSLPVVRSIDIAVELDYKKSSISIAMKKLRENGYITTTDAGFIYLTEQGEKVATRMYERHNVISSMLESIGVDKETAAKDACRIEHVISDKTFEALKKHQSK